MAKREADKQASETRNPFLPTLSIRKWQPDKEAMKSIDETTARARGGMGEEPDQWHKDYKYARR